MDFLGKFTDYFLDNNKRFTDKLSLFVLIAIGFFSIDYFFRFSDSYITKNKIEQIEKIERLLAQDTIRAETKKDLVSIENEIISRKSLWTQIGTYSSFFSFESLNSILPTKSDTQTDINQPTKKSIASIDTRSAFFHNLTSGWIFWLMIIITPFIFIGNKLNGNAIIGALFMDFMCVLLAYLFAYWFAFIPIIWTPIINYILNALLCLIIIGAFAKTAEKFKKA